MNAKNSSHNAQLERGQKGRTSSRHQGCFHIRLHKGALVLPITKMSEVTLRTRKFLRNPLLARRQMVVYVNFLHILLSSGVLKEVDNMANPWNSDVLHPQRPNVSKEELRDKLSELYKCEKDQVNCFGFRTQYGGGKSTGFALIYDSPERMKRFEPHYRLVRVGLSKKIEKPSRQQRKLLLCPISPTGNRAQRATCA